MEKRIILGVAFDWGKRKGLDIFKELAQKLDRERYLIILVGTNDNIDIELPENIVSIHRTQNQKELAKLYTAADLFFNPTREDNYPTVNMEALACGTPVLTFDTGGCSEIIDDFTGKAIVEGGIRDILKEIELICEHDIYKSEDCLKRAKKFDKKQRFDEYIDLYEELGKWKKKR